MVLLKILKVSMLIGVVSTISDNLFCCSPGVGSFQYEENESFCFDEKTNKSSQIWLTCDSNQTVVYPLDYSELLITDANQIYIKLPQALMEVEQGTLCFANVTIETDDGSTEIELYGVSCSIEEEDNSVLSYCKLVSAVFLILTAIVYAVLPEVRDLQGKSIVNFCGSLAIGLTILAFMNLLSYSDMELCAVRGFLVYFFIIASFFWTNAISIQILLSLRRPVVHNYSWKEFSWYALYAWGCTTFLTMCMAIVNYHPGDHLKPGIGLNHCWFFDKKQQWHYMYSVMTILIVCNICIFIYISIHIWRLSFSSNQLKALRYKFVMTLRLIIIMGLPWIFEMISSLSKKHVIWYILDLFNMLQGPLIFLLLVVFRKRVVKALLKRGLLDCVAGPVEKYLAVKDDEEEGVMQHTIGYTLDERNGTS